jgi:hypothetical protein
VNRKFTSGVEYVKALTPLNSRRYVRVKVNCFKQKDLINLQKNSVKFQINPYNTYHENENIFC